MSYRLISKVLGVLLLIIAIGMATCAVFASGDNEWKTDSTDFLALTKGSGATFAAAVLMILIGRRAKNDILRREAIVAVGLCWILAGVFGAIPFVISQPSLTWDEAFFETMSGFTTTGSTVMQEIEAFPRSILLWRSLTQWMGGIGIVVLFVAVLSFLGVGSRSLIMQESSLNIGDSVGARIRDVAVTLCKVYVLLTLSCFGGLVLLGMTPFDAICHAFTTISTGGFSTHNDSLAHYSNLPSYGMIAIELWVGLFMFLGSISFMLYVYAVVGQWTRIRAEEEARYYFLLLIVATIVVGLSLSLGSVDVTYLEGIRRSFFTVISISTTTGFGTEDFDQWPVSAIFVLIALMIIGGCAGSTAGGLKMNRLVVATKVFYQQLVRGYRPTQTFRLRLNGKAPGDEFRFDAVFLFFVAGITVMTSIIVLAIVEQQLSFLSVIGGVFGTLFNIGPGFEMLGPTDNYSDLSPFSLIFLSFLMLLGRLEFYAILVLFLPSLWRRY